MALRETTRLVWPGEWRCETLTQNGGTAAGAKVSSQSQPAANRWTPYGRLLAAIGGKHISAGVT